MGQDLKKKLEDDLSAPPHVRHPPPLLKVDPGVFAWVLRPHVVRRPSLQFDVWISDGALQTLAVSHSSLLILISWEVEPVGRYRDQLGGGEGGDPGHDFHVVATCEATFKVQLKGTPRKNLLSRVSSVVLVARF